MKQGKDCDCCGKVFEYSSSRRPDARFCSLSCLSKLTKKEQDLRRIDAWSKETEFEYLKVMSNKFDKFVIRKDGCWDWNGSKNKQGYGVMLHRNKYWKAHRASYFIYNKKDPGVFFVLHSCDNPSCSNPSHLFLGTNSDNMRDMASKKRNVARSKLTEDQVRNIKKMLKLGVSATRLGIDYAVSDVCIHYIKHNITWKDIN